MFLKHLLVKEKSSELRRTQGRSMWIRLKKIGVLTLKQGGVSDTERIVSTDNNDLYNH